MRGIRLRAYRTVLCLGLSSGIMGLAYPTTAWALTYPSDENWLVLTRASTPIGDGDGDSPGPRDIVGNAAFPMAYVQSDATHLYFRLRINESILSSATNVKPYGWGCVIDIDGDQSSYEYSTILDGVSNPDTVWIWSNSVQDMPNDPTDAADMISVFHYADPFDMGSLWYGYAREQSAGTYFPVTNPDPDVFADWAIERKRLAPTVGPLTPLRFACGSAADGTKLSQDFSGPESLPDLFSDPVLCDDNGCVAQTCPEFGTACSVGIGGCASTGTMVCLAAGPVCNASAGQPSSETCNGVDDDCNGAVDEGQPGSGMACTSNLPGICSDGTTACVGGALVCNANASPQAETCNGIDDDCNGVPDDGPAGLGDPCVTGYVGVCATGFTACGSGQIECLAVSEPGVLAEACNGVDDDCNGMTDEGFSLGTTCTVGVGACAATGQMACDGMGAAKCDATPGTPVAEVCGDLMDSDCDGNLDNSCPDTDGDGLPDHIEIEVGTDPNDADSDDDGVRDGSEVNWDQDSDGDGTRNVLDPDSDNDGIFDGTEMGLDCGDAATDVNAGHCIADADQGMTTTDPIDADTDDGSVPDGTEDINKNGVVETGEKNPLDPSDDVDLPPECTQNEDCNAGQSCVDGVCVNDPIVTAPECTEDQNCGTGEICVDGRCTEGCRGKGAAICPVGQVCTSTGSEAGECVPEAEARQDAFYAAGGGCDCQTGSSRNTQHGFTWTVALAIAALLRRKRR
jgi:hypothetical protein